MSDHRCAHDGAVPVESSGVAVAYLCPTCDDQLPDTFGAVLEQRRADAAFRAACPHEDVIELRMLGELRARGICDRCGQAMRETPDGEWEVYSSD